VCSTACIICSIVCIICSTVYMICSSLCMFHGLYCIFRSLVICSISSITCPTACTVSCTVCAQNDRTVPLQSLACSSSNWKCFICSQETHVEPLMEAWGRQMIWLIPLIVGEIANQSGFRSFPTNRVTVPEWTSRCGHPSGLLHW
jgi:hypothetical protein